MRTLTLIAILHWGLAPGHRSTGGDGSTLVLDLRKEPPRQEGDERASEMTQGDLGLLVKSRAAREATSSGLIHEEALT